MLARSRSILLVLAVLSAAILTLAQSAPQLARDHIYGPGGRLAVTIEPDNYPPGLPSNCSASQSGPCAEDGIDVSWGVATDIGSGVAGYNGPGGYTTGFSYHDSSIIGGNCYVYYVSAVDNAGHEGDAAASDMVCVELCWEDARNRLGTELWAKWLAPTAPSQIVADSGGVRIRRVTIPFAKPRSEFALSLLPRNRSQARPSLFPNISRRTLRLREPLFSLASLRRAKPNLFQVSRRLPPGWTARSAGGGK